MKEYTDETIRLRANEVLLASKGFALFAVDTNGDLLFVADNEGLSPAERRGLYHYSSTFDPRKEKDNEN